MSILDGVRNLVRPYDDDDDMYSEDEFAGENPFNNDDEKSSETETRSYTPSYSSNASSSFGGETERMSDFGFGGGTRAQLVIVKPDQYKDATDIADHICNNRIVVINFEKTDSATAVRLMDFVGGAAYAQKCVLQAVTDDTIVIAPKSIGVSTDIVEKIKNNEYQV